MIFVDSREQLPYWKGSKAAKTALLVGDYTTFYLMGKYHIERKSLVDLYGTVTKGHYRFKKEILRAKFAKIKLEVVVEGSKKDFKLKKFYKGEDRLVEGETLIKIVDSIERKHKIKFHWCSTRDAARKKVLSLLRQRDKTIK